MKLFNRTGLATTNPRLMIAGFWLKAYQGLDWFLGLLVGPFKDKRKDGVLVPSWIKRVGALALDCLFSVALVIITLHVANLLSTQSVEELFIALAVVFILPPIYSMTAHLAWGKSFGKYVFGLTIRSNVRLSNALSDGHDPNEGSRIYRKPTRFQLFAREVFKVGLAIVAPFVLLLMIVTPKTRGLHELLSSTITLYEDKLD